MREETRSRKAFDMCQVRAVIERPYSNANGSMVCAKYPTGFQVGYSEMNYSDFRATLALTLGCLACPYRKTNLQTGESAIEAIKRLSSQESIDQLNLLFQGQGAPEPPRPPDS